MLLNITEEKKQQIIESNDIVDVIQIISQIALFIMKKHLLLLCQEINKYIVALAVAKMEMP